jgi:hypothetical protein
MLIYHGPGFCTQIRGPGSLMLSALLLIVYPLTFHINFRGDISASCSIYFNWFLLFISWILSLVVGLLAPFHYYCLFGVSYYFCVCIFYFLCLSQDKSISMHWHLFYFSHYDPNSLLWLIHFVYLNFLWRPSFLCLNVHFRNICLDQCRNCMRRMRSSSTDLQRNRD